MSTEKSYDLFTILKRERTHKSCRRRFRRQSSGSRVQPSSTIFEFGKKACLASSFPHNKRTTDNAVLTERNLDENGSRSENSPC
jgi:hypothetical protein